MKRKNPKCVRAVAKKANAGRKAKRNGSEYEAAAAMSEDFHGTPPHEEFEVVEEVYYHENLAICGELIKLEIIAQNGGIVDLKKFDGAWLAMSPKGYAFQLYIEGGDQSVPLEEFGIDKPHELEVLGKLKFVTYYTVKHHLGRDGGEANYRHKLNDAESRIGTKAKNRPTVIYDVNSELLMLAGGEYEILPEGIDN